MTPAPARSVAAELRRRLPHAGALKIHKLLYYVQGHHLAAFGRPIFRETLSAWDKGPVVGELWFEERTREEPDDRVHDPAELSEADLNTIGYVVSRYGALTGLDLQHLTHQEDPWREADRRRSPGTSAKITPESLAEYFANRADSDRDDDLPSLDEDLVQRWLSGAQDRLRAPSRPDDLEELRARAAR